MLKTSLQNSLKDLKETKQRLSSYDGEIDKLALQKARRVLEHQKQLGLLRDANQAIIEAALRLVEAKSDVAALKERNSEIVQRLEEEKQSLQRLVREAEKAKAEAKDAQNVILELLSTGPDNTIDEERRDFLSGIKEGLTLETMDAEIQTEKAKLDLIHAADPGVLQEFEKRARDIERGQRDKAKRERQLESLNQQIQELKDAWEPAVDAIINRINDAFSYNFEQINCAGEVSIHKDEDFDKWAIDIRVKFRYVHRFLTSNDSCDESPLTRMPKLKRERNAPKARPASSVRRRALRLHHFLPHVAPVYGAGALPRRRRDQSGHGPAQRAHDARAHGGDRVQRERVAVLPHHAQAPPESEVRRAHEGALRCQRRTHAARGWQARLRALRQDQEEASGCC